MRHRILGVGTFLAAPYYVPWTWVLHSYAACHVSLLEILVTVDSAIHELRDSDVSFAV